jgi:hypothetical protein
MAFDTVLLCWVTYLVIFIYAECRKKPLILNAIMVIVVAPLRAVGVNLL